jgi:hypothetical protein
LIYFSTNQQFIDLDLVPLPPQNQNNAINDYDENTLAGPAAAMLHHTFCTRKTADLSRVPI